MSDDLVKRASFALSDMQGRIDATKLQVFQNCIDRIEELEGQLQSVLDRETSILRYYDAKLDAAEAKLAVVEKERDDLRALAEAETREGEEALRNNAMNHIDRRWKIDRTEG